MRFHSRLGLRMLSAFLSDSLSQCPHLNVLLSSSLHLHLLSLFYFHPFLSHTLFQSLLSISFQHFLLPFFIIIVVDLQDETEVLVFSLANTSVHLPVLWHRVVYGILSSSLPSTWHQRKGMQCVYVSICHDCRLGHFLESLSVCPLFPLSPSFTVSLTYLVLSFFSNQILPPSSVPMQKRGNQWTRVREGHTGRNERNVCMYFLSFIRLSPLRV